jgi:mono/diheme cytochrome c family protein
MLKRIVISFAAAIILCVAGFAALAWRPPLAPIAPRPSDSFSAESIHRGEILAGAGYCAVCHTRQGGRPFAGGYALPTPFGTIYSTNITPDPETGIGRWSLAAFTRAMHEGVRQDGAHLFPAFPYDHFTKISDQDASDLYAYVMTRAPVRATPPANTLPFPFNVRALQEGWKMLFFKSGRFEPDASKSAEWNRGAYLAEGLSHCGGCHTPRNWLGAERTKEAYAGAEIEQWIAPALTDANPSPMPWTQVELFNYLRHGVTPLHGVSTGPMAPVVRTGLSVVSDADIQAVALYFADVDHAVVHSAAADTAVKKALATSSLGSGQEYDPDARLYAGACIGCHYNGGAAPLAQRPELALNSALMLSEPTNFIHVVLEGIGLKDGGPGMMMPGYANLTDAEIGRLATYLRRTRAGLPPWADVENKAASLRVQAASAKQQ